jgi:hypothetical protein
MLRLSLSIAALVLLTLGYASAEELRCQGAFAKDMDHKRLVAAFGQSNVKLGTVREAEGVRARASIVFPKDPARRLEVVWFDEKSLRHPRRIDLAGSGWSGPGGLRIGASLEAVETANGKPFILYGFEWDYGGTVESWNGGMLGKLPGGCSFYPIFEPDDAASAEALTAVASDNQFTSDWFEMKAAKPRIRSLHLSYPEQ